MNSTRETEQDLREKSATILCFARNMLQQHQQKLSNLGREAKKQQSQFRNVINVAIDATDVETIQAYILYRGTKKTSVWSVLSVPVCKQLKELIRDAGSKEAKLARARLFFGYLDWAYSIWSKGGKKMKEEFWDLKQT